MGAAGTKKQSASRLPDRVRVEGPAGGVEALPAETDALRSARIVGKIGDVDGGFLVEGVLVAEQLGDELAVFVEPRLLGRDRGDVDPGHCFCMDASRDARTDFGVTGRQIAALYPACWCGT